MEIETLRKVAFVSEECVHKISPSLVHSFKSYRSESSFRFILPHPVHEHHVLLASCLPAPEAKYSFSLLCLCLKK